MGNRDNPPVPAFSQCVPPGQIGYEVEKARQRLQSALDRRRGSRPVDISRDGPTGELQDLNCLACGKPLVSKEYILWGKPRWTTIHDTRECREKSRLMCRGCVDRIGESFRPKQKPARLPYHETD